MFSSYCKQRTMKYNWSVTIYDSVIFIVIFIAIFIARHLGTWCQNSLVA